MQSTQREARCLAMFSKCYQFTALLRSQSQSIAGRLKQQHAATSVHDPPRPEACVTHDPPPGNTSGSRPNSGSASCLLKTSSPWHPISSLGYLAGPPLFPREPSVYPFEMFTTLLAYIIFLAVSHYHQVGGGQRWCFIYLCNPSIRAGCGG